MIVQELKLHQNEAINVSWICPDSLRDCHVLVSIAGPLLDAFPNRCRQLGESSISTDPAVHSSGMLRRSCRGIHGIATSQNMG